MATYQEQLEKARKVREAKKKDVWAKLTNDYDSSCDASSVLDSANKFYGGKKETLLQRSERWKEEYFSKSKITLRNN